MTLAPYTGTWTIKEAKKLVSRSCFGPSIKLANEALDLGLTASIEKLLEDRPLPPPPVKHRPETGLGNSIDPDIVQGETFVDLKLYPGDGTLSNNEVNAVRRDRLRSLAGWQFLQINEDVLSIREKMTMFWHNHFVVAEQAYAQIIYGYITKLREGALGNFKELTKQITIDPGMLAYLNGNQNSKNSPNENYARELLELFTVGKGELAGPGDYTTFTEKDVEEIAKVLTGWTTRGVFDPNPLIADFEPNRHNTEDKTLSHRFSNTVITNQGDQEYANLIDVIFENDHCASYLARKLFRWFIQYEIDDDIDDTIIQPLATIILDNNYELKPAISTLLGSEFFFQNSSCMIKNPVDFIVSATRGLGDVIDLSELYFSYEYGFVIYSLCADLGMGVFDHETVAGWIAYYQEPQYYRFWINNLTLPKRNDFASAMVKGGTLNLDGNNIPISARADVLGIAESIDNSTDPNDLIDGLVSYLFAEPITQNQKDYLKEILIPGLPDFEWTVEYGEYLANPTDNFLRAAVEQKLRELISSMVQMPEFQLI